MSGIYKRNPNLNNKKMKSKEKMNKAKLLIKKATVMIIQDLFSEIYVR